MSSTGISTQLPTGSALTYLPLSGKKPRYNFKNEHPFEKRKAEADRIRQKYADRIPVSSSI